MGGYTKLWDSIITSTVWCEDDKTRILWITLLAVADKNGNVSASLPGLAVIARLSLEDCQKGITKFLSPDPYSRTKTNEGRRIEEIDDGWHILNYMDYRNRQRAAERTEYLRIKKQEERAKKANKENTLPATSLPPSSPIETPPSGLVSNEPVEETISADLITDFVVLWNKVASSANLPNIIKMSDKRVRLLRERDKDPWWRENWHSAMEKIPFCPFLCGKGDTGWKANGEWFLKPSSALQIMEGKYNSPSAASSHQSSPSSVNESDALKPMYDPNDPQVLAIEKFHEEAGALQLRLKHKEIDRARYETELEEVLTKWAAEAKAGRLSRETLDRWTVIYKEYNP